MAQGRATSAAVRASQGTERRLAMTEDHVHPIADLGEAIGRLAGEGARAAVMAGCDGIATASEEKVASWLKGAVERLDALVDEGTRARIMVQCGFACAKMNYDHIERALARRNEFDSLDAYIEAEENNVSQGFHLERDGDVVYQYYSPSTFGRRCFCSLWLGLPEDEDVSLTWCQCSKGFVMKLWEALLAQPAQVEVVETCISGADRCKFAIYLPE